MWGQCHEDFSCSAFISWISCPHFSCVICDLITHFNFISLRHFPFKVIRDMQQYILLRLANEESLRVHMNRDTAEMLNQLHIKSNGCFLYLERVLDGIAEGLIILREIKDIPGTLNGLYLWLSQRLLSTKQFLKVSLQVNLLSHMVSCY